MGKDTFPRNFPNTKNVVFIQLKSSMVGLKKNIGTPTGPATIYYKMAKNKNLYHEQLQDHLKEREWDPEDIEHFLHMVGRSALLSSQSALNVLQFQQATEERIQAEQQYDALFAQCDSPIRRVIPQDFFEQRLEGLE